MRRISLLAAVVATTAGVFAQGQSRRTAPLFVEQPGVMEFSGRMIARPVQPEVWSERNFTPEEAQVRRAQAHRSVAASTQWYIPETDEYVISVPIGSNENETATQLMATGNFQYVEPDWTVHIVATPNDPSYGLQWHLPKINAPGAWDHINQNSTIIVAITDTGVRLDHQDLASQLVPGANSNSGTAIPQGPGVDVNDTHGHGTHCAGIAGARGNNSIGVSGVNWNVKIMPIKVTSGSGGSSSITALTAGARYAADNGARVISTSFSGFTNSAVQTTGNYIKYTRNGIYLWAAGNDNVNRTTGDHVDVTIVGASTESDGKASFSAYGIAIDLFAPGVSVYSTYASSASSYTSLSGTSMACPCAAGSAALIMGTNPALTGAQVETILYQTCFDLTAAPGGVGNDNYWGWGRVDVRGGVRRSYDTTPFNPTTMTVEVGTLLSGSVAQLGSSDDQKVNIQRFYSSGFDTTPVSVLFQSVSTNNLPSRVDFVMEGMATIAGIQQRLYLYNFTTNQWVNVDTRIALTTDTPITITPANSTQYREAGTGIMRARLTFDVYQADTVAPWEVRFDRIGWLTPS